MLNKHLVIILYFIIRIPFSLCASPISQDEKETDSLYQTYHFFRPPSAGKSLSTLRQHFLFHEGINLV